MMKSRLPKLQRFSLRVRKVNKNEIWYLPYTEFLLEKGAIPETINVPHKFITRGEVAELMYQLDGNKSETAYILKEKSINEETEKYEINIKYPEFIWDQKKDISAGQQKAEKDLNALIIKSINSTISLFKDEIADYEESEDVKCSLYINYSPVFNHGKKIISIKFTVSTYTGGAHPNSYTDVINYDLVNNKKIELKDLFQPESNYLSELSEVSKKYITNSFVWRGDVEPDSAWINTGSEAKEESFLSFNIKATGLVLTFDPYQVAPYAAGAIEITIPYAALKSIMRNKSPLSNF